MCAARTAAASRGAAAWGTTRPGTKPQGSLPKQSRIAHLTAPLRGEVEAREVSMDKINQRIATELGVGVGQVAAAVELLGEGATVPFIARYRKEKTGGLDDTQLRKLEERLGYLRELEDRRATVLKSIEEQGKLTPELARARSMARRPRSSWRTSTRPTSPSAAPRRRSRARPASSRWPTRCSRTRRSIPRPRPPSSSMPSKGVADAKAALDGARHILIERIAEDADARRRACANGSGARACSTSKVRKGKAEEGAKFSDYFDFGQRIKDMPSHRALAMLRGRNEGVLDLDLDVRARGGQAASGRSQDQGRLRHRRARPPGRCLARRDGAAGLEGQAVRLARSRPAGPPQGARRRRGDLGVLRAT